MKKRTVRGTLLGTYSIIIVASFFALAALFSVILGSRVRSQTLAALRRQARAAAAATDLEIDRMSTMAMNISYSTRVQDRLFPRRGISASDEAEKLSMILSIIVFPNRPIDQINLYTQDGMRVSTGLNNGVSAAEAADQPWYDDLAGESGHQRLFYSGPDESLSKYATGHYARQYITLAMALYDNFGNGCGFVEIKQRVSRVASAITSYSAIYGENLQFFGADGSLICPQPGGDPALFEAARDMGFPEEFARRRVDGAEWMLCCAPCGGGRFYAVMGIRQIDLLRPVLEQIATILLITLAALTLAIVISHLASRRITAPIDAMCEQIGSIDIGSHAALPELDTDLMEMQTLHDAFARMQSSLTEHVDKLLELQNQEMQSRMLALQAQMNPHFLFNSLQAIQAMADEGMNREIGMMCQSMANILRYISSDSAQLVPLEDELKYTQDYLRCMDIRYQGDLQYHIDVPEAMNRVAVPKLCVQLLVENAIKFTTTRRPPYRVRISGTVNGDDYELAITDNGPGFGEDTLKALYAQMDQIRRTRALPSLKINGMGILHVFIRFCLLYDNQFTFRLENNQEGGACVFIGANIHESEV